MNYTEFMEIRVSAEHDDGVTIECPLKDFYFNPDGSLHGGLIATIADEAVWFALERHYQQSRHSTTTELKVNYLRPATGTGKVFARARLIKAGKTLCVGTVELSDERGALCAFATVTYMMLGQKEQ
ncbi:MAG: PaaI family thioesterase [Bryobacteraceae bacterium]|nr:PaaI family thioesterase [Bryobacteraceae bacterium]